jgi:hypothetical protein
MDQDAPGMLPRDKSICNFDYLSYNYLELKDEPERV